MRTRYEIRLNAKCPVNSGHDSYSVTVEANRTILVEDLLALAKTYEDVAVFQEDLTVQLAARLSARVETVGFHSGVRTTVVHGEAL